MIHRNRRTVFAAVAMALAASVAAPQQSNLVVWSASGTAEAILKVKALEKDRRFVLRATGDAAVRQGSSSTGTPEFSIRIRVAQDKDVREYGCGTVSTAKQQEGIGRLHVETSCEIVVLATKMVTITAEHRSSGGAKPENITLQATSSWYASEEAVSP